MEIMVETKDLAKTFGNAAQDEMLKAMFIINSLPDQ